MTIVRMFLTASLVLAGCSKGSSAPAKMSPAATDRFEIKVTDKGFEPDDVKVPAGRPVTLVFERMTDETCAKQVVLTMADGSKVERDLPLGKPIEIATTFPTAGKLAYACGMDMVTGTITVQ